LLRRGGRGRKTVDQDFLGFIDVPVELEIGSVVWSEHRTRQRNPREEPPRTRVTKDFGMHLKVGGAFRGTPHRHSRRRRVPYSCGKSAMIYSPSSLASTMVFHLYDLRQPG